MTTRRAVFPLAGLTIEITGDQATVNGLPVEAAEAERMLDQYLADLLHVPGAGQGRAIMPQVITGPVAISVAPVGADPADPSAWTDLGTVQGIELEMTGGRLRQVRADG